MDVLPRKFDIAAWVSYGYSPTRDEYYVALDPRAISVERVDKWLGCSDSVWIIPGTLELA